MFVFDFDYVILNIILLLLFCYSGNKISKGSNYWAYSIPCIILYTFVLGSRYGRGNDYFHYVDVYLYGLGYEQKLFTWFNNILKDININPYHIFYFYAFCFISSAFIFFKLINKNYLKYIIPLFLIATIKFEEYQIRQAFGFVFIFFFIYELFKDDTTNKIIPFRKIILCFTYAIAVYSVHSANIFIIVVIFVFYLYGKRLIPLYISIPLYIYASYYISYYTNIEFINPYLEYFGDQNELFSTYVENSDKWFSAEGYDSKYLRNNAIKLFETLGNISLMYYLYKTLKLLSNDKWAYSLSNTYIVGSIFMQSFMQLELLNRMGGNLLMFWFVPLSIVLYNFRKMRYSLIEKITFVFLLFWVYEYLKYLFYRREEMIYFLWDIATSDY